MSPLVHSASPVDRYYDDVPLVDLLDQLISTGVVLSGDVLLSVAGVDLVWVGLRAILSSVETARPRGSGRGVWSEDQPRPVDRSPQEKASVESESAPSPGASRQPEADQSGSVAQREVNRVTDQFDPPARNRLEVSPEKVEQGLVRLVLTIVELLRQVLERQAIDRMDGGSLSDREIERLGLAFAALDERMEDLKEFFGIDEDDLELNLGPLTEADHSVRTKGEVG